jgi:predicted lipase
MIKNAMEQAKAQHAGYNLVVTGHSLGAGIASIAATTLHGWGINTTTYTYGQPRTGNVAYAKYVDEKMGGMYRVTYKDDGICQIPPATQGYRHHTTEYWVNDPPSPANTKKCEGQEDKVRSKFPSYE